MSGFDQNAAEQPAEAPNDGGWHSQLEHREPRGWCVYEKPHDQTGDTADGSAQPGPKEAQPSDQIGSIQQFVEFWHTRTASQGPRAKSTDLSLTAISGPS